MALTAMATEVPGAWAVRLQSGGSTGTVLWVRDEAGRQTVVGEGVDLVDRLAPLNTLLVYTATDDTGTAVTGTITVASTHPVLSSTMWGTASQVTIVRQSPNRWRARSVWHPVIDKSDGPTVAIFDAEWREGDMVLDLPDRNVRADLLAMLMRGDPLILRATCPDRVDGLTILPLEWSDPWVVEGNYSSGQRLEIRYQSVVSEPPAWVPPPDWTYQDALAAHVTYQEWLDVYPTYTELLAGVP